MFTDIAMAMLNVKGGVLLLAGSVRGSCNEQVYASCISLLVL